MYVPAVDGWAAECVDDRGYGVFGWGVGTACEEVDVGEVVFGPGGDGEVGFGEDEDAGGAVGLEGHDEFTEDGAAELCGGGAHGGEEVGWLGVGCRAVGEVVDGVDHDRAPVVQAVCRSAIDRWVMRWVR
jgi:hypothetical protein